VPASIKLQEEYGDTVQVVFVAVQGETPQQAQAFALKKKWLGGRAMWTSERPFDTGLKGIPATVLVSSAGDVLFVEYPIESKLKDLIEEDLKAKEKGPKDAPDPVRKAWAEFGKGNWGKAVKGEAALTQRHADALAKLNGEDLKAERDAATALSKLEKKLYANGPEDSSCKALEAFAEKYGGTKAGDRAKYLDSLLH